MAKFLLYLKAGMVHVRITHHSPLTHQSEKVEISTGQAVPAEKWDPIRKKMKGTSATAVSINNRLIAVLDKLRDIETSLQREGPYSARTIKERYQGGPAGGAKPSKTFLTVYRMMLTRLSEEEDPEQKLAEETLETYEARFKHTAAFIKASYGSPDVELARVDEEFMDGLKKYLIKDTGLSLAYAAKHLEAIKKVVRFAISKRFTSENLVEHVKISKPNYKKRPILHLSREQLEALETATFPPALQQIVDCAVFQCHTGIGYRELYDMEPSWIVQKVDGSKWIEFYRKKTQDQKTIPVMLPLDAKALALLDKYRENAECQRTGKALPVNSNQDYNRNLKIVGVYLGLSFPLKSHHLRKTAAQLWLIGGVPLETVSLLLGDSEEVTRTHYARATAEMISKHMQQYAAGFPNSAEEKTHQLK